MMTFRIRGGRPLSGELSVSGSKNAALPILAACLLIRETVELSALPEISDTAAMLHLLTRRGVSVTRLSFGRYRIDASGAQVSHAVSEEDGRIRGSLYLLGAELAAFGESEIGCPGGCNFGERPIDIHLHALRSLGAEVNERQGRLYASAPCLEGNRVTLRYPSVGATVNAILASTMARGRTILVGAAVEPHVFDLVAFLSSAGAKIQAPAPGVFVIEGGFRLHGTEHRILPDMIEAGSYLLMTAATRGEILLRNAPTAQLKELLTILSGTGCEIASVRGDEVRLAMRRRPAAARAVTAPYPGFPTDLHPQLAAYLALGDGVSEITETVFEGRFRYLSGLSRFGAQTRLHGSSVSIVGVPSLVGARVSAPDLRASAAYLTAALAADGESLLCGAELLFRGYETPLRKLRRLGAIISDGGAVCDS